jgi:hypothetical protein
VNVLTRPPAQRSERDELEARQGELRDIRRQREALPREQAELKAKVAPLEEEVRWLRRTLARARGEWEQAVPSLPERLVVPFRATPSRRTAYGRMRFALRAMVPVLTPVAYCGGSLSLSLLQGVGLVLLLSVCFGLMLVLQGNEDDDEVPGWSFEEESFSQVGGEWEGLPVRYAEVESVEVDQDWLQRRYGFGSVQVTFRPSAPTPVGKPLGFPDRRVDLDLLDDPERLATWLRERVREARAKGGAHGG